jgi:plastocyanin
MVLRHSLSAVLVLGGLVLVTGCGGDAAGDSGATRSYEVELRIDDSQDEYRYVATGDIPEFTVGDEVTFVVENTGTLNHDLQVQAPDGDVVAVAPAVAPGDTLQATALLGQEGVYRLNCLVDDHLTEHSMQTLIQVAPAES